MSDSSCMIALFLSPSLGLLFGSKRVLSRIVTRIEILCSRKEVMISRG
jgi:hypothetical protein